MWSFIVKRGAGIGSFALAMAAQFSGFTNAAIALALVGVALFFLVAPVWHYAHVWHKNRLAAGLKGVDADYLIIGGLSGVVVFALVAVGGYVWKLRNPVPDPRVTALQTEVETLRQDLAKARQLQKATPQPNPPKPEPQRYTPYEKEQRLRAVDDIYNVIATQLQPAYREGRKVIFDVYRAVDASAEQHLTEYAAKVQGAFDSLNLLLKKYSYFTDIVQATTKNTFNDVAATHGVTNLVGELHELRARVPSDIQWFLLRDTTMLDAINQINDFQRYLDDTLPRLREKRAEIEKAEVYSGR
jgi:hypothetical protein